MSSLKNLLHTLFAFSMVVSRGGLAADSDGINVFHPTNPPSTCYNLFQSGFYVKQTGIENNNFSYVSSGKIGSYECFRIEARNPETGKRVGELAFRNTKLRGKNAYDLSDILTDFSAIHENAKWRLPTESEARVILQTKAADFSSWDSISTEIGGEDIPVWTITGVGRSSRIRLSMFHRIRTTKNSTVSKADVSYQVSFLKSFEYANRSTRWYWLAAGSSEGEEDITIGFRQQLVKYLDQGIKIFLVYSDAGGILK